MGGIPGVKVRASDKASLASDNDPAKDIGSPGEDLKVTDSGSTMISFAQQPITGGPSCWGSQ